MLVNQSKTIFDTQIKKKLNYVWAMIHKDNVSLMLQSIGSLKEDVGDFFQNLGASLTWTKRVLYKRYKWIYFRFFK